MRVPEGLKAGRTPGPTLGARPVNRALYAVLALAAILATLLLLPWPAGSRAPTPPVSPLRSAIDEPPNPDPPPLPSTAPDTPVARQEVEVPAPPTESAPSPSESTGRLVLRGEVAVGGELKPYPILRVRAVDAESGETIREGDSSESGSYVLSGDIPLARVPFEVIVEAEGEGLIPAIGSRAGVTVEALPLERGVFPIALHRPIEVRGRVLDLFTSLPIPGARISQSWRDERIRFGWRARFVRGIPSHVRAVTDAEGEFRALVPAALRKGHLLVEAEGFLPGVADWQGEAPPDSVEIRVARMSQVPSIRGRVSGEGGQPAAGVRVKAEIVGNRESPRGTFAQALIGYSSFLEATQDDVPTARTDGAGEFLLPIPYLGRWKLYTRLGEAGLAEAEVEVADAREYPCEIRPAADAVGIVGTVRGRRSGRPVASAVVQTELPSGGESDDIPFRSATLQTDEEGAFRLGPVPRQVYALYFRAKGFAPVSVQVTPDPDGPERRISVEMDEECRLRGTTVDEVGRPVARARVLAQVSDGGEHGRAAEDGRFEIGALPAGVDIRLSARAIRPPETGAPSVQLETGSLPPVRFSAPGEERDLGRVVLRRK